MFRTLLGAAFGVAAALLGAGAGAQATRPQAIKVAPDTWMVQGLSALSSAANRNFISNSVFVVTRDGVVVDDALGSPALAQELLPEIRRITPAPVRYVIVTHCHADHVYGLQALTAAGATVVALDKLLSFDPQVIVPGHGPMSTSTRADLELTRADLEYLRQAMGGAARNMDPFEEAYARTDWSRFDQLPLFGVVNRINAYNTYLLMEQDAK